MRSMMSAGPRSRHLKALIFGIIPWIAYVVISPLLNMPKPLILGMPPMFFWDIVLWLPLTSLCLYIAYRIEFGEAR